MTASLDHCMLSHIQPLALGIWVWGFFYFFLLTEKGYKFAYILIFDYMLIFVVFFFFKMKQLKLFAVKYNFCLKQYFKTLILRVGVCS